MTDKQEQDTAPQTHVAGSIDSLASAFQSGFTNGNAVWNETPEHHREMFREGVRSLLRDNRHGTCVEGVTRLRVTGFRGNPLRLVLSNGGEATITQKLIDSFASPSPFEQHSDDVAVDRFAVAMKAKLSKKRADGAGGWDDPEVCHIDYLVSLLLEQIHERAVLDPIDIANIAMMIHERGETPSHGR